MTIIIDGSNLILGRLATYAAKEALLGEEINIVNCEKIYISGNKENTKDKYKQRYERGQPIKGPFQPKSSERIVRRTIRGMLPYKQLRGKEAFARIRCYNGVPAVFKDKKMENVKGANISKLGTMNYMSIIDISKALGK